MFSSQLFPIVLNVYCVSTITLRKLHLNDTRQKDLRVQSGLLPDPRRRTGWAADQADEVPVQVHFNVFDYPQRTSRA